MFISNFEIKPVKIVDAAGWAALRTRLWPAYDVEQHLQDITRDFAKPHLACFLAWRLDVIVGFLEVSLRSIVDGCESTPVAFIEGWYVLPEVRTIGVGKALVNAAERWATGNGCSEIGSDTELHNHLAIAAHKALGFREVDRVVQFMKKI